MPFEQDRQAYFGRRVTPLAHVNMRCRAADDAELGRDYVKAFGRVIADLVQVTPTAADLSIRLDHLFDARQMLGQRTTVGIPGLGWACLGRINRLIFGMDHSNCRLDIFQRQLELIRIDLLGFAPEHRLFEGCNQQFQPINPLLFALIAGPGGDQHRLQGVQIIGEIGGAQHGQTIAESTIACLPKRPAESSCRSYSTAKGARTSKALTRRQSRPENSASNWAWPRFITPSLIAGQVNVCSSSRL